MELEHVVEMVGQRPLWRISAVVGRIKYLLAALPHARALLAQAQPRVLAGPLVEGVVVVGLQAASLQLPQVEFLSVIWKLYSAYYSGKTL